MLNVRVMYTDRVIRMIADAKQSTVRKFMRRGVLKGVRIMNKEAKQVVPVESGALKKSLAGWTKTTSDKRIEGWVRSRGDAKMTRQVKFSRRGARQLTKKQLAAGVAADQFRRPAKYMHLVAGGRKAINTGEAIVRKNRKSGAMRDTGRRVKRMHFVGRGGEHIYTRHVRAVAGRDFLGAVYSRNRDIVPALVENELATGLAKIKAK